MNELTQTSSTLTPPETPVAAPALQDSRISTAIRAAQEKKGLEIVILDISKVSSFADYFVLCSGTSTRHVQAIAEEIERKLLEQKCRPHHIEGYESSEWVLFDYGDLIIHVFTQTTRAFYDLERLWRDAQRIEVKDDL